MIYMASILFSHLLPEYLQKVDCVTMYTLWSTKAHDVNRDYRHYAFLNADMDTCHILNQLRYNFKYYIINKFRNKKILNF